MSRFWIRLCLIGLALAACLAVLIGRTLANSLIKGSPPKGDAPHSERATTEVLGGAERCLTFVSTDKPIYRATEKVYVRGVLLNAVNHKPLPDGQSAYATIEIKGPKGDTVAGGGVSAQNSVWGFAWAVPQGQAGGEYTIHVKYPNDGYTPAVRKFDIRAYRAPRLKSQITFLRDGYGPGDKVQATLDVKRAEGGIPEGAKVTVMPRVDGVELKGGVGKVDAKGLCSVSFDLPSEILRGEGTLALVIEDGGVVETASKTIPILLQTVDLKMFPEGGELVAGYKNRVYIQANQPNGKPADLVGKLMSKKASQSEAVADFRTEHEGRGRFEFTPEANREYFLTISEPAGIKTTYPLPKIKPEGALIHSDKDVFKRDQPVSVQVGCTDKHFQVTLAKREVQLGSRNISADKKGRLSPVSFDVPSDVDGVLTVTVWDKNGVPLAERLVFREPAKSLNVSITPGQKSYVPGDTTKLTIKATDGDGKPVSTVVGLTVTDDSVLEMVEKREQAPHLPVMVFLEPEVKDLADAHVYLDPKNPKAPMATDLLLGTQGWRRFALMQLAKFIETNGEDAQRVVALKIPTRQYPQSVAMNGWGMGVGRGAWAGAAMGGAKGMADMGRIAVLKGGMRMVPPPPALALAFDAAAPQMIGEEPDFAAAFGAPHMVRGTFKKGVQQDLSLPEANGRVQGPRDANMFQVEPSVVDERHFAGGRAERHQKTNEKMPAGSPMQDSEDGVRGRLAKVAQLSSMNRAMFAPMSRLQSSLNNLVMVREFAHQVRNDRKATDRVDFAETLYWNTGVKTDPTTGEATVSFGLNDSVTTFRVFADAFASNGAVGTGNVGVEAVQPFYAEAKLPLEVTAGDRILLPIALINATIGSLADPFLKIDLNGDFKVQKLLQGSAVINANDRVRWIQPIDVGFGNGQKDFVLNAKAGLYEDKVSRTLSVKPKGFPIESAFGGIIEPGKPVVQTITIPEGVVPQSMISNTAVYPTPLANLTEALQRMIQDPNGCFEQTSSTSYPLTMAQQYFLSHAGVDPKLVETAREKLDVGYKKLVGFWCPDRGYEWFGQDPGHEALTAFGLLHFTDMAQVRDVDQNMLTTTRSWLLKQKDGQGGFTRKRRALHSWIEDKDCSNAYILWALLESGQSAADLKPELDSLKTAAGVSQNYYVVALAANALQLAGNKADAKKLMDRLVTKQKADGSVDGVTSSIVGSGGDSLEVEGTAFATLAWLRDPAYAGSVEKSIKFLADSCKDGRYGSTQATVLALRSIVTYDKQRARPKAPGKVQLYVDGQSVGDWVAFDKSTQGAIKLPDASELLTAGNHKLELKMDGGGPMPYSLAVKYNAITPASASDCKLDLTAKMAQDKVMEGASTEANVTVINKTKDVIPNPVAIIGLPGGLEPRHDQLKELVKKGTIDAYEVLGREVVLYWRTLPGDAKVQVPLSLIAAVPGSYTGPASRAYLYYTDEQKQWVDGLHVEIAAK